MQGLPAGMGGDSIAPEQLAQMMGGAAGKQQGGTGSAQQGHSPFGPQQQPSEVGTVGEEIKGLGSQFSQELQNFFSLNYWMGVDPNGNKSPEEQAKARQIHSRYQQLTQEQQHVFQQQMQREQQQKRMRAEEDRRRKQRAEQNTGFVMPSGPKKGAANPSGSNKQKARQRVDKNRTANDSTQGE